VAQHLSEIADAKPPHTPCGCPFQAWSVGEALRVDLEILADAPPPVHPFSSSGV
jgi:glycogen debranching enzyme